MRVDDIYSQNFAKVRNLLLWTKRGAMRHAKFLSTDAAWDAFDLLEDTYFETCAHKKSSVEDQHGLDLMPRRYAVMSAQHKKSLRIWIWNKVCGADNAFAMRNRFWRHVSKSYGVQNSSLLPDCEYETILKYIDSLSEDDLERKTLPPLPINMKMALPAAEIKELINRIKRLEERLVDQNSEISRLEDEIIDLTRDFIRHTQLPRHRMPLTVKNFQINERINALEWAIRHTTLKIQKVWEEDRKRQGVTYIDPYYYSL